MNYKSQQIKSIIAKIDLDKIASIRELKNN